VLGHTKMGYDLIFPNTAENAGGAAARIGWWEVNESFVTMGTFPLAHNFWVFTGEVKLTRGIRNILSEMGQIRPET